MYSRFKVILFNSSLRFGSATFHLLYLNYFTNSFIPLFSHSRQTGLLEVHGPCQTQSCFRAFAFAIPSACKFLALDINVTHSHSFILFGSLLTHHLQRDLLWSLYWKVLPLLFIIFLIPLTCSMFSHSTYCLLTFLIIYLCTVYCLSPLTIM